MIKEFQKFISRGNVVDLAVGVIIGGAFSKIVSSLVDDILMPILGIVMGGIDFSNQTIMIGNAKIAYGMFIQNIIDFLIIAFCVFFFVKIINRLTTLAHKEEKENKTDQKETELMLLKEIRDELKKKNSKTTSAKKKKSNG